jgi:hypothetical protein
LHVKLQQTQSWIVWSRLARYQSPLDICLGIGIRHAGCSRCLAARHYPDLACIEDRTAAALGLHHPDDSAGRSARLHLVELVPEWFGSPGAREARKRIASKLDPEKRYRELSDRLAATDTIANREALAAECLKIARFDEAERHYDHILELPMGCEPAYALGNAQAAFGCNRPADALATLDHLKERWPEFESADGHLLYARALAEIGRSDEALDEYHALAGYFPGAEAKVRYGMLLKMAGRTAEARAVFNELLLQMRRAPKYLRDAQAEWLSIAEKQLSA